MCVAGAWVSGDPELDWVPNSLLCTRGMCAVFFVLLSVQATSRSRTEDCIDGRCEWICLARQSRVCVFVAKPTPPVGDRLIVSRSNVHNNTIDRIENHGRAEEGAKGGKTMQKIFVVSFSDHAKNPLRPLLFGVEMYSVNGCLALGKRGSM